jgi:hypothetical protein
MNKTDSTADYQQPSLTFLPLSSFIGRQYIILQYHLWRYLQYHSLDTEKLSGQDWRYDDET